ncbi:MAG: alpha/beta hydrolase [Kiloniellaceae bacterium]
MHIIATGLVAYLALTGAVFVVQRALLYPAGKEPPRIADAGVPGMRQVEVETHDGLSLVHWYRPPASDDAPVVVAFHGNAGHLGDRVPKLRPLLEAGFGVLFVGYRGYGGNPGRPNEADMSADARGLLDWLAGQGIVPARTVLYGESLGTGLAVKMAAERPVAAVILESPYTSIASLAQMHYWYLPAQWLVLDKWESIDRIGAIGAPLLVLHGGRDTTVPLRYGQRLFEAAPEPKEMVVIERAGHVDLFDYPEVVERVLDFARTNAASG